MPEQAVVGASVFMSRPASLKRLPVSRSSTALFAPGRHREKTAKENGLFYALSVEASFDVGARRCPSSFPRTLPAEMFAVIPAAAVRKNFRRGC